jgi:hypothetical protein
VIGGALALVFVAAAGQKAIRPRASSQALATYSLPPSIRRPALVAVIGLELALAAGLALGFSAAAWAGAGLTLGFAALAAHGLRSGRAGAPCACFGPGSRLTWFSVLRNLALAAALAVTPVLPDAALDTNTWLAIGLGVALAGVLALGVAVAALAREVGLLRRELVPAPALEIPHEGPELGVRSSLIERFALGPQAGWALAVFTSEGCRLCQLLGPSVAELARDPLVEVEVLDEHRDALVWRALGIPGSPFAVAMDPGGRVLAKGTFNSPAQLEGVLAAAERRRREPPSASVGPPGTSTSTRPVAHG